MNVEISVILHMCVLGNWVCGYPKVTEWVFKAESDPSATHALLNPWYLQCRSCTGRVLCSATTVWASHCPSQRMCGGCYYCNAVEWPLKTAAMDGARRGSPPGVHIQVQSSLLWADAGNIQLSLVKITAYFWTSRVFELSCMPYVR